MYLFTSRVSIETCYCSFLLGRKGFARNEVIRVKPVVPFMNSTALFRFMELVPSYGSLSARANYSRLSLYVTRAAMDTGTVDDSLR
jgi:hypothetical protein